MNRRGENKRMEKNTPGKLAPQKEIGRLISDKIDFMARNFTREKEKV